MEILVTFVRNTSEYYIKSRDNTDIQKENEKCSESVRNEFKCRTRIDRHSDCVCSLSNTSKLD